MKRSLRLTPRLVLVGVLLFVSACGNRLSRDEILAANVVTQTGTGAGTGTQSRAADGSIVGVGSAGQAGGGQGAGGTVAGGSADPTATGANGAEGAQAAAGGAPMKVGLIGWLSGLGGSALNPARDTWIAWQRSVNARGGIDGHPVELLVGDDGGDAATSLSIARDFVENQGVVALTYVGNSTTLGDYAASKNIPIIGTITSGDIWHENPYLFMPFGGGDTVSYGAVLLTKQVIGATKAATIYCAETADCNDGNQRFAKYAQPEGISVVAQIQYSVTQPDFTAECLRLKGSGAEVVLPVGDNSSFIRMVQSCARQGYKPPWLILSADDSMAAIPELDGSVAITPAFPWFLRSGGPAIDEYVQALQTYAPSRLDHGVTYQAWGWQSAKLLEAAARGHLSTQPTSQDILNGLWSLQGETYGGLAPGSAARSFAQGQPSTETYCIYPSRIQGGAWTAPNGLTPTCR